MLLRVHVLNEETDTFLLMSTQLYLRKIICMTSYMLLIINSKLFLTAYWPDTFELKNGITMTPERCFILSAFFFTCFCITRCQVYYNIYNLLKVAYNNISKFLT